MGTLSHELERDLWIWRPILDGKCTLEGVKSGLVTVDDLLRLNALMDMKQAMEAYAQEQMEKKTRHK